MLCPVLGLSGLSLTPKLRYASFQAMTPKIKCAGVGAPVPKCQLLQ